MGKSKGYKVIDTVQESEFAQWVGGLVKKAIRRVNVEADIIEIYAITDGIGDDPCVHFRADEQRFILRILVYMEIAWDSDGDTCAEKVAYALYEVTDLEPNGTHIYTDNPIAVDTAVIKWDNAKVMEMIENQRSLAASKR